MKITCVLVTYNRLPLLKQAISGILSQKHRIDELIIVDNGSTDGTAEYIKSLTSDHKNVVSLRLSENMGGAGGFHFGIKEAYYRGADWVWTLDDDCIPTPEALERLIRSEVFSQFGSSIGFLCSRVDWVDGSVCRMNVPRGSDDWTSYHPISPLYSKVEICSFVSVLFRREAIKTIGFPIKEFFIWFDDVEFTRRISQHYQCFYVADSIVIHHTPHNYAPGDYSYLNASSLWKFKYGIRNEVAYVSSLRAGLVRGFLYLGSRLFYLLKADRSPWQIFHMMLAGFSGFFFRYKNYIEIPHEE